jgi:2-keto-3-deoxy-L-rhamnonate aldolase RhmA
MPDTFIPANRLKSTLRNGGSALGTMLVEVRQPSIMQILSNAGFDFVLIDGEHGPFSIETVADLSRAARQAGLTPIVRVAEVTYAAVTQPLDAGAQGVMIPRITDPEQVRSALEFMKYPPVGKRGSVLARGHTEFKAGALKEALSSMNDETMLIVQIETKQAVDRLDEILSIQGVDAALVGPTDLTVSYNKHGRTDDAEILAIIMRVIETCRKHSIIPAIHMNDLDGALLWAQKGMRMVSFNSEVGILTAGGRNATTSLKRSFPND